MRGTTGGILQHHQILRLPRKMTVMTDPRRIWNAIYNVRNNKVASSNITKYCACHPKWFSKISETFLQNRWNVNYNARPIRDHSENDPSWIRPWNRHPQPASQPRLLFTPTAGILYWTNFTKYCACHEKWHFNFTKYCACHAKWLSWSIRDTHETLFTMRGATSVIVQTHQILRLPRKMTLQNFAKISRKQMKRQLQCATDPRPFRDHSEHETVTPQPTSQPRLLFTPTTGILYWKIQRFVLRLSFQISPNTAPATKSDTSTSPNTAPATKSDTWTSPKNAPAMKSDTWTSPNSAPATKTNLISNKSNLKRI